MDGGFLPSPCSDIAARWSQEFPSYGSGRGYVVEATPYGPIADGVPRGGSAKGVESRVCRKAGHDPGDAAGGFPGRPRAGKRPGPECRAAGTRAEVGPGMAHGGVFRCRDVGLRGDFLVDKG